MKNSQWLLIDMAPDFYMKAGFKIALSDFDKHDSLVHKCIQL